MHPDILNVPMGDNDAEAATIGEYLIALLATLWEQKEAFKGKCPFGNSAWEYEIYKALGAAGIIDMDESHDLDACEKEEIKANRLVAEAIQSLKR